MLLKIYVMYLSLKMVLSEIIYDPCLTYLPGSSEY